MCGRYSITLPPEAIRQIFQTHGELPNWPAYYNAAPTTAVQPTAPLGKMWSSEQEAIDATTLNDAAGRWAPYAGGHLMPNLLNHP
jgi:putative SOS response-associated peptidase YedK